MSATERERRWAKERGWSRGHWERFPELCGVRGSRDGEVARRERADSSHGSQSLWALKSRGRDEGFTELRAERGVVPRPGAWRL